MSDYGTYVMGSSESTLYLAVYVDDMLIVSPDMSAVSSVKDALSSRFEMKDLGEVDTVLGMRVRRNIGAGWLFLDQETYSKGILAKFNMLECKPSSTPLSPSVVLTEEMSPSTPEGKLDMQDVPYRSVVGSLMYLMVCTAPKLGA